MNNQKKLNVVVKSLLVSGFISLAIVVSAVVIEDSLIAGISPIAATVISFSHSYFSVVRRLPPLVIGELDFKQLRLLFPESNFLIPMFCLEVSVIILLAYLRNIGFRAAGPVGVPFSLLSAFLHFSFSGACIPIGMYGGKLTVLWTKSVVTLGK